jgi:hypothetical protein
MVGLGLATVGALGAMYVVLKHHEAFMDFLVLAISILFIMMGAYIVSVASEEI